MGYGTNQLTGQPITVCEWIDRLAPKAWAIVAAGTRRSGGTHRWRSKPGEAFVPRNRVLYR